MIILFIYLRFKIQGFLAYNCLNNLVTFNFEHFFFNDLLNFYNSEVSLIHCTRCSL